MAPKFCIEMHSGNVIMTLNKGDNLIIILQKKARSVTIIRPGRGADTYICVYRNTVAGKQFVHLCRQQYPILDRVDRIPSGRRNRNPTPAILVGPVLFVHYRKDLRDSKSTQAIVFVSLRQSTRNNAPPVPLKYPLPETVPVAICLGYQGSAEEPRLPIDMKGAQITHPRVSIGQTYRERG